LVVIAAPALLAFRLDSLVMADKSLVNLHHPAANAERREVAFPHRFPNPMAHEPRRLQRDPKRAVKLVRRHAFLAARDKEDRLQPDIQRNVRCLEDGADGDAERLAAVAALVDADAGALAKEFGAVPDHAALRAYRPVWP